MKLAINKVSCKGLIVTDEAAAMIQETHRIVDVKETGAFPGGVHYQDVWGGTWLLDSNLQTKCTCGAMDKWA